MTHLSAAYDADIRMRLDGGEPSNKTGGRATYGYRIVTCDRTIVISGDTGPSEEIVRQYNGCDVLVHEVR